MSQIGPELRLEISCFDCVHCKSESYQCQSDSGFDLWCGAMNDKSLGNSGWHTPSWCPFLVDAKKKFAENMAKS